MVLQRSSTPRSDGSFGPHILHTESAPPAVTDSTLRGRVVDVIGHCAPESAPRSYNVRLLVIVRAHARLLKACCTPQKSMATFVSKFSTTEPLAAVMRRRGVVGTRGTRQEAYLLAKR